MIDALLGGTVYGEPRGRTAKNGEPFVTLKLRVPTRDGESQFVDVIAFDATTIATLLALDDHDAVAVVGELTAGAYLDKAGEPRPSLHLLAHAVLSQYHLKRKREAVTAAHDVPRNADGDGFLR